MLNIKDRLGRLKGEKINKVTPKRKPQHTLVTQKMLALKIILTTKLCLNVVQKVVETRKRRKICKEIDPRKEVGQKTRTQLRKSQLSPWGKETEE